jgi:hypothetical protein
LLSTTRRSPERGQVLVLFGGGIVALLIIAALAFDVGMTVVERRDQQNAADAAALAGARFLLTDDAAAKAAAEAAARQLAIDNGFNDADASEAVNVFIPPIHGKYKAFPRFIEVQIEATRPSVFGGVFGKSEWPVGAFAVATNAQNLTFPFSMMALDPTACEAIKVTGGGIVEAYANIQSNSTGADCVGDPVSFKRAGGATIDVIADDATCRAVGEIVDEGTGYMTCTPAENSFALPDPLRDLPAPAKPLMPTQQTPARPMVQVGHSSPIPDYCPGATPASKAPSETNPRLCKIPSGGSPANQAWILYPGLYPGGLEVDKDRTVYLMPGIYWIGGGGLIVKGGASIVSIETETDAAPNVADATWGGGVLFYNSTLPVSGGAAGEFHLNGSGATMKLKSFEVAEGDPLDIYNDIVIFQDRTVTTPITLNGSSSGTEVEGVIYAPDGQVKLNGNGGTLIVDQVIAGTFDINGNGGTIKVLANKGFDSELTAAGLVE